MELFDIVILYGTVEPRTRQPHFVCSIAAKHYHRCPVGLTCVSVFWHKPPLRRGLNLVQTQGAKSIFDAANFQGFSKDPSAAARALKIQSPICIRPASADPQHHPHVATSIVLSLTLSTRLLRCIVLYLYPMRSISPTNAPRAYGISYASGQCDKRVASAIGDITALGYQHRNFGKRWPVSCILLL